MIEMLLYAGVKVGELISLEWGDIDFEAGKREKS